MLGRTHVINGQTIFHGVIATGLVSTLMHVPVSKPNLMIAMEELSRVSKAGYLMAAVGFTAFGLMLFDKNKTVRKVCMVLFLAVLAITMSEFARSSQIAFYVGIAYTLGTVGPDIDSEKSILGRYVPKISKAIPHRTITHTIWAVLLLYAVAMRFQSLYILAFTLGYYVHILQDSFSRQGIAWTYPLRKYITFEGGGVVKSGYFPKMYYRTGTVSEEKIFNASVVITLVLFVLVL